MITINAEHKRGIHGFNLSAFRTGCDELHQALRVENQGLTVEHCMAIARLRKMYALKAPTSKKVEIALLAQLCREYMGMTKCAPSSFLFAGQGQAGKAEINALKADLKTVALKVSKRPAEVLAALFPMGSIDEVNRTFDYLYVLGKAIDDDLEIERDVLVNH